ncbi:MAG: PH domain-containing protein [Armatimonadetes bacterium]|nr:PH domain-containing protein [Armatimonadota bacterium]
MPLVFHSVTRVGLVDVLVLAPGMLVAMYLVPFGGVRARRSGLRKYGPTQHRYTEVDWADIEDVEVGEFGARIHHAGGTMDIPAHTDRFALLMRLIAEQTGKGPGVAAPALSEDDGSGLLGAAAGETVRSWRLSSAGLEVCGGAMLLASLVVFMWGQSMARHASGHAARLHALAVFGAGFVGLLLSLVPIGRAERWLKAISVRAEPAGLVVRRPFGRETIPWVAVRECEPTEGGFEIHLLGGLLRVPDSPAGRRLEAAVQRVLAAREQGQMLPRLGFVGDAAISPVREGEERAERGLSRTEEG